MFRNTGANAVAKNQTRLAYEDKRDLYCKFMINDLADILYNLYLVLVFDCYIVEIYDLIGINMLTI